MTSNQISKFCKTFWVLSWFTFLVVSYLDLSIKSLIILLQVIGAETLSYLQRMAVKPMSFHRSNKLIEVGRTLVECDDWKNAALEQP